MLIGAKPHDGCKTNLELTNQTPYLDAEKWVKISLMGKEILKIWVGRSIHIFESTWWFRVDK
jgi:hypothetical protein